MKRFNFLLAAFAIMLTITAVSCTTMGGPRDDYYNRDNARTYGDRVYVDDPYRGTVVLQRDPRTGRYYEISSPYGYYGDRYYGSRYGYGYGYSYPYSRRSTGTYRRQPSTQKPAPTQEDRKARDEARKKILGDN